MDEDISAWSGVAINDAARVAEEFIGKGFYAPATLRVEDGTALWTTTRGFKGFNYRAIKRILNQLETICLRFWKQCRSVSSTEQSNVSPI